MKTFFYLFLLTFLFVNSTNAQCGLYGDGTNGTTVACGSTINYTSNCNFSSFYNWSIGGSVDIFPSTSLPLNFQTGDVGGTVVSASANNIRILWDCAITTCDAMTTLEHNGTEFFNPVIRIEGENCGSSCTELPTYQRYSFSGNVVNFYANCGYCVTFNVSTSAGYFTNQQVYVSPPGTSVTYAGTIYGIYNVQYSLGSNCSGQRSNNKNNFVTQQILSEYSLSNRGNDYKDANSSASFHISPNPASNLANIQLPNGLKGGSLEIYNNTGQLVYSKVIKDEGMTVQNVEVQDWSKGLYIVVLKDGELIQQSKLMIQ